MCGGGAAIGPLSGSAVSAAIAPRNRRGRLAWQTWAGRLGCGLSLLLVTLWAACDVHAGDGDIRWQTMRSPHADVHFPRGYEALARHVAATASDAHASLVPLFHDRPRPRLQVTIDDFSDDANGFATCLPYDQLHLQAYPPDPLSDLGDHGDWIRTLVFHEYAHLLHMGDVSGPPAAANVLLGRQFLPNTALPRLLLEGIAVWTESRHTGADRAVAGNGGRIGSAQYGALLRAAVLDGTVPQRLDELGGRPLIWPRGNAWYLYGGVLVDDLVQQHGASRLRQFIGELGRQVVPWGVQGLARHVWGASLERLWRDARQRLIERTTEQIRTISGTGGQPGQPLPAAVHLGDGTRLTHDSDWRGRIRLHPDGQSVLVARAPRDGLVRIERIQLGDGRVEVLHTCALDCDEPVVTPDGRWLLLVASRRSGRLYLYRELVAVALDGTHNPLRRADGLRITQGMRVRSVSIDADGKTLALVVVRGGQTAVAMLDWPAARDAAQAGRPVDTQRLAWRGPDAPLGTTVDTPVVAGGALWWTAGRGGQRALYRATLGADGLPHPAEPQVVRLRGDDPWLPASWCRHHGQMFDVDWLGDLQAVVTPMGVRLGGLVQLDDRRDAAWWDPARPDQPWQLRTRSAVGLYSVAHGTAGVASVRQQGRGLDVWRGPERPPAAVRSSQQGCSEGSRGRDGSAAPYQPAQLATTMQPYSPWPSLRPRSWTPLWLASGDGPAWMGAMLSGRDAVGYLDWVGAAQVRTDGSAPVLTAEALLGRWEPLWSIGVAFDHSQAWFRRGWSWMSADTARLGLRSGGAWTVPHLRSAWQLGGAMRWTTTWLREPHDRRLAEPDPGGPPPIDPQIGHEILGDAYVSYSDAERYPESIAVERQHSATLRVFGGGWLGAPRQRLVVQADGAAAWPLGNRHIVEASGHVIGALQPGQTDALYRISGILPLQALAMLGLGGPTGWVVRGAPRDTGLGGQGLAWGTLAWRMPLTDIGRTLDLLPLYAGRLHGSLFSDAAWAFWQAGAARTGGLLSLGAELQLDIQLGYGLDGNLRAGAAWLPQGGGSGWVALGL